MAGDGQTVWAGGTVAWDAAGRLTYAGPAAGAPPPFGRVFDLDGWTVLPGLIDCHVHLASHSGPEPVHFAFWGVATPPAEKLLHAWRNARTALRSGVTTLRNMGERGVGEPSLRDAINQGVVPGPRILTSASVITMTGGHADLFTPAALPREPGATADGPDAVRQAVRADVRAGADFIKFTATGGVLSALTTPSQRNYSPEEVAALVDEAHALERRTAAHAHGTTGIKNALRAGVDTLEHGTMLDEEAIDLLVGSGAVLVPTLTIEERIVSRGVELGISAANVDKARRVFDVHRESVRAAHAAGVPIAMGTDSSGNVCPFGGHARELVLLQECGLAPLAALAAGTGVAAAALGLGGVVGTLAPGAVADLVAVPKDLLADVGQLSVQAPVVWQAGELVSGAERLPAPEVRAS